MSFYGPWYGATEAVAATVSPGTSDALEVSYVAAINGVVWGQTPDGEIVSYDVGQASNTETFSMRIVTGMLKPADAPLGWGRVRSININGEVLASHTLVTRVYADERDKVIADKDTTVTASDPTNWPYGLAPEVRTTSQRCQTCKVELIATPAAAEWASIDVWATGTNERGPSRSRS